MIDFSTEQCLRIGEAAAELKIRYQTIHRWVAYGCKGRKLEAAFLGGLLYTSREALQRFSGQAVPATEQPVVSKGHEEAMRRLARRGIGVRNGGKAKHEAQACA